MQKSLLYFPTSKEYYEDSISLYSLQNMIQSLPLSIPLSREIILFSRRNIMRGQVCLRCLKAYTLSKAKNLDLPEDFEIISRIFKCETGHNDYYLDKEDLEPIPE
ncbi:MAG: hypothetical protein Q7S27_00870 [Nanoarchaeota archaeon]|nr:hypothetical protein [Nanoarchaeota archaeon]